MLMQLKDSPPKKREPSVTNSDYHPLCEWCVPESETTVDVNSFKTSLKDLLAKRTALCRSHQPDRFQLCKVASRKLRSCTRKRGCLGSARTAVMAPGLHNSSSELGPIRETVSAF